ncbi:hypothetical protein A2673_00930 [Candidatus Kaiserbacteria bacterium RIFCSPHIGHO2_01_FULL_50_13]|uniref:Segregation and condensation protein A n=1 Tax=Candidatus Kaiserbacteria bacterium RIFCSPLOWO2_01_FULL_50_24 TaxID=1798507 RepID=A0A1F6EMT5_9BACT|nr:MAG: hypothetical protein A2673_00930 [Candidatus Kaiserbacteria bacterium RIFCSPHIGHO2_01_FULL_50_13]OGG74959.1 MAG: hypothetical protein A3A34_04040 [Candidatus Kaiserbacteria bacterium RIFCSPLOWO2_01_FULL_50_24]OGG81761.1 MAG: hypothetical protein A3H74_01115 [Candidatus Kaiserbacteria bacterium RIFCSPLOWO2_02_FULL_51_13]
MNAAFTVSTRAFAGSLEVLLDLIEARKLPISEVSLSEVADAYLAHVEKLPAYPLAEASQFVLVASTLLLIKSRALLPFLTLSEEEKESVDELERRLKRLRLVRRGAKLLRSEWGRAPLIFPKRAPLREVRFAPGEVSVETLGNAIRRLIALLPVAEKMVKAVVAPVLALEDVIKRLHERLRSAMKTRFSELTKKADKHEVIVYFLAALELVRSGSISATQEKLFSDITLEAESLATPKYGA